VRLGHRGLRHSRCLQIEAGLQQDASASLCWTCKGACLAVRCFANPFEMCIALSGRCAGKSACTSEVLSGAGLRLTALRAKGCRCRLNDTLLAERLPYSSKGLPAALFISLVSCILPERWACWNMRRRSGAI
jgi:hypothetical protein